MQVEVIYSMIDRFLLFPAQLVWNNTGCLLKNATVLTEIVEHSFGGCRFNMKPFRSLHALDTIL